MEKLVEQEKKDNKSTSAELPNGKGRGIDAELPSERDKRTSEGTRNKKGNEKRTRKRFDKNTVIAIVVAVVMIAIIAIVAVVSNLPESIDKSYFVSDDRKLALSLKDEIVSYENSEYEPPVTHIVYYCDDGGRVVNVRIFFDYDSEEEAREANQHISLEDKSLWAAGKKLNGKYIIFDLKSDQYEDMTREQVEQIIESLRNMGGVAEGFGE